jgi:ferredoxin
VDCWEETRSVWNERSSRVVNHKHSFFKKVTVSKLIFNNLINLIGDFMTVLINKDTCTGCETCVDECPAAAIEMVEDKAVVSDELCVDCGSCVDVCPAEAITMD